MDNVILHAKQVICHANSVTGLVESLVGVVPGGGGCKETLYRWVDQLGCGEVPAGTVLCEQDFYDAERGSFERLTATLGTRESVNTMLDGGKPVRN